MKAKLILTTLTIFSFSILFSQCSEISSDEKINSKPFYGGFESQIKWGEHLVQIGGCGDCHTPKKMTPKGPVSDNSLMLSGHPAELPYTDVDRKEMESKGLAVTQDLTAWVGPWGVSYAANLTPDETGIGNWQESNFITALREGKFKGISSARSLLPPMPLEVFSHMSVEEIKAIFAYLKSIKPVRNLVPQALPPVMAGQTPPESSGK